MKITENYIEISKADFIHIINYANKLSGMSETREQTEIIMNIVNKVKHGELYEIRVIGDK